MFCGKRYQLMENKKGEGTPDDMLKLKLLLEAT